MVVYFYSGHWWIFTPALTVSAGNRSRVEQIHRLLREVSEAGDLGTRFYSVVDRDSGHEERVAGSYHWDRYHIENYLLEPKYILIVLKDLDLASKGFKTSPAIMRKLKECANETLNGLLRHELGSELINH